ncbi:MAG: alpha/beta hydrolase [Planctomycetota bacterium]
MHKILFLHGLDAAPGGFKPTYLRQKGFEVLNPALPKESLEESFRIAAEEYHKARPPVIVGSSRGGAVAMAIAPPDANLVLIAPAWRWCEVEPTVPPNTIILHSQGDEIIPFEDSVHLVANNRLPIENFRAVGVDHRMNDPEALDSLVDAILRLFKVKETDA